MEKMTIRDIDVKDKRVLVRVDLNVPLDENNGNILDDSRLRALIPTINYLREHGAKIILYSHNRNSKGDVIEKLDIISVAKRLHYILGVPVSVSMYCIGPGVEEVTENLQNGDILILENFRYHDEEERNDTSFAWSLSRLADVFVNDDFSACHRIYASTVGIARYLPAVAGFLVEKEVDTMNDILKTISRPSAFILGGSDINTKIAFLEKIIEKVDFVLLGGSVATTFFRANNYEIGKSFIELEALETVDNIVNKIKEKGTSLILPQDVVVSNKLDKVSNIKVIIPKKINENSKIVDIGPSTIFDFYRVMRKCKTIFWDGTMGIHEIQQFAGGTRSIARLLANLDTISVVGGDSTSEVVYKMGLADNMSFVSTGDGAFLEFFSNQTLPGLNVLLDKPGTLTYALQTES